MKKLLISLSLVWTVAQSFGQNIVEWSQGYEITLDDFQSKRSKIDGGTSYLLSPAINMEMNYTMNTYEFMMTKNFNSKISCNLQKSAAVLIAPDEETARKLLAFANFQFDLTELYTRKFRKEVFENKGAFSDPKFFKPLHDQVNRELSDRNALALEICDAGMKEEELQSLHREVLAELEELRDFCKECKPAKKKK